MTVFKVLEGVISSGSTTCTFTDSDILENSILDFYFTDEDVVIDSSDSVVGSASVTINALNHDIGVALFINNVEALDYPIDANDVVYGSSDVGTVLSAINSEISNINQSIVAHGIAISQKQDQLTAGDNITIVDNVISATGGGSGSSWTNLGTINVEIGTWVAFPDWLNTYNEICISAPYNYELGDTIIVRDNLGWCLTVYTGANYHNSVVGQIDWQNGKMTLIDSWSVGFSGARTFNIKAR